MAEPEVSALARSFRKFGAEALDRGCGFRELAKNSERLKSEVDTFLNTVRSF